DFVIYVDGGESFGKEEYVTLLKSDDIVVESLTLHNVQISVSADRSMAWSRYQAEVVSHSQGARHDVSTLETLVFQREGNQWLIRHAHVALAPLTAATASAGPSSTGPGE
ncbi:MAG: nuclear transport factor 2 family protein, partial [Pseudomonadota bacterium]